MYTCTLLCSFVQIFLAAAATCVFFVVEGKALAPPPPVPKLPTLRALPRSDWLNVKTGYDSTRFCCGVQSIILLLRTAFSGLFETLSSASCLCSILPLKVELDAKRSTQRVVSFALLQFTPFQIAYHHQTRISRLKSAARVALLLLIPQHVLDRIWL